MKRAVVLLLLVCSTLTRTAFAGPQPAQVIRVVAGDYSTCALLSDGSAKCWGHSLQTLTNNATLPYDGSHVPQPVLNLPGKIISLAVGQKHACASFEDGSNGCWGEPDGAESYYLNGKDRRNLVPVVGFGFQVVRDLSLFSTNKETSCAVQASSGKIFCWGPNRRGMRGVGIYGDVELLNGWASPIEWRSYQNPVVKSLVVGESHSCMIFAANAHSVYCWGNNTACESQGACENGRPEADILPLPRYVFSDDRYPADSAEPIAIGVGGGFTCLQTKDGTVDCWGFGFTTAGSLFPEAGKLYKDSKKGYGKEVFGQHSGVVTIAASGDRACAIKKDGTVWCWGAGYYYDGQMHPPLLPWKVEGLEGVRAKELSMSGAHACVLTESSQVYCWGYNPYGQIGRDTQGETDSRAGLVRGLF